MKKAIRNLAVGALALSGATLPAKAEMGTTLADVGEIYASIALSYVNADGINMEGHQRNTVVPIPGLATKTDVEHGASLEGTFGFVFAPQLFGLEKARIETTLSYTGYEKDRTQEPVGAPQDLWVDPNGFNWSGSPNGTFSQNDRETFDVSLALKGDHHVSELVTATFLLELFYRNDRQDALTTTTLTNFFPLQTDVDAHYFGVMLGVQPEFQVTENIALVADLSGGIYGYSARGFFNLTTLPICPSSGISGQIAA